MRDLEAIADRVEIETLRGEFSDAAMMREYDRIATLFNEDGALRMPNIPVELIGHDAIIAGRPLRGELRHLPRPNPRTSSGWRFTERLYEVRYRDTTPLAGRGTGKFHPPGE